VVVPLLLVGVVGVVVPLLLVGVVVPLLLVGLGGGGSVFGGAGVPGEPGVPDVVPGGPGITTEPGGMGTGGCPGNGGGKTEVVG
jgi:hypothetical protein